MIQPLAKAVVYPTHYLRREKIGSLLAEVETVNRSGLAEIEQFQKERLCEMVRAAIESGNSAVDALRSHTRHITCDSIMSLFTEIPFQSKAMVRHTLRELGKPKGIAADYRSTSGSTGYPLQFYKDRNATGYMDAVLYAAYAWHSIKVGDPQARFWGMPLLRKDAAIAKLKDTIKNRIRFSAFDLSDEAKDAYYRRLKTFNPAYFYGYPSLMVEFCNYADTGKISLKTLPLKAVIGTGEYVLQHERNIIEQTTGARFVNEYGCTEAGLIGFECEQRNLHVMSSNIYLEIIKDGKNVVDEEGDIYVTELNTRTNPFIRYELGDRGILCSERCPCGRALPVIKVLFGRKNDYVITPEGNKIYAAIFSYILKEGVDKFKVIQSNINSIDIYIVVNDKYSHSRQNIYHQALQRHLSDSIRIDFHIVKSIKHDNSGKLKYFERTFQQC